MEVVASLSQVRTAAAQCGLFTHKSVPVIFEPPCTSVFYAEKSDNLQVKRTCLNQKSLQGSSCLPL